jgi:signal transduction histidine kinase
MSQNGQGVEIESVPLQEVADALLQTRPFAGTSFDALRGVETVDRVTVRAGGVVKEPQRPVRFYWVVLVGEIKADRQESDGSRTTVGFARTGEGFGEAPLLTGKPHSPFVVEAIQDSLLVRFTEEQFWALLACCPAVRKVVLNDVSHRLQAYQVEALHREKLVSLGTLAAGLMHELHNPGTAAKRAASQLRENLLRLQQLSLRFSDKPKTQNQLNCIKRLLEHALHGCHARALSTLDEADAEEAMAEWLALAGVENAHTIAPTLVSIGFDQAELGCANDYFEPTAFSDTLNWLEALVSSVSLVCAIEESITRVSDLVMAVKKFAYDDRSVVRELDVHDSLQSTLTILGHKIRIKQIGIEKRFEACPSTIRTRGSALSQVWTNLIDNAIDASPENGQIEISSWTERPGTEVSGTEAIKTGASAPGNTTGPGWLAVSIADQGTGIAPDVLPHIFEAFFTTKAQGTGTGLGLEIVHRIVTQKFGGTITVESEPGNTRFTVRLPLEGPSEAKACTTGCN